MLVEPAYVEFAEVLQMISRSPEDRHFYEARLKFLHDEKPGADYSAGRRVEMKVVSKARRLVKFSCFSNFVAIRSRHRRNWLNLMTMLYRPGLLTTLRERLRTRNG